jgi:hypothetical protein
MTTYRVEIKYSQRYRRIDGYQETVYAEYPHCPVERLQNPNSIILQAGAVLGGWDLKTLVKQMKRHVIGKE